MERMINGNIVKVDKDKREIEIEGIKVTEEDFRLAEGTNKESTIKFANLIKNKDRMIVKLEEAKEKATSKSEAKRYEAQIKEINAAYNFAGLGKNYIPENLSVTKLTRTTDLKKLMKKTNGKLVQGRNKAITPLELVYDSLLEVFAGEFHFSVINKFMVNYIFYLTKNVNNKDQVAISLFLLSKIGISRLSRVSIDGLISEDNRLFAVAMKEDIKKILVKLNK